MLLSAIQPPIITLRQPIVWAGIMMFFVNNFTDKQLNIPLCEFVLLGLIFLGIVQQQSLLLSRYALIASVLAGMMILWMTTIDFYHLSDIGHDIRVFIRTFLFYAIVIGYMLLPNKNNVLRFMAGFTLGYIFNFILQAPLTLAHQGVHQMWQLKYLIPTPAVVLLMLLHMPLFTPTIRWILIGYLLYALAFMPLIGSRGAFISLFVGLGFYALSIFRFIKRDILIITALYIPLIPATIALIFYERGNPYALTDQLYAINYATHSNVERTLMLHMNIEALSDHPLFGIGSHGSVKMVEPYFVHLTKIPAMTGESPHNYYMEYTVPYGLPTLILLLMLWYCIYHASFMAAITSHIPRGNAAFACGVAGWIMLYQPVAGITRLDVFMLLVFGLYVYAAKNTNPTSVAASSPDEIKEHRP